jgi:hypothetical protein
VPEEDGEVYVVEQVDGDIMDEYIWYIWILEEYINCDNQVVTSGFLNILELCKVARKQGLKN